MHKPCQSLRAPSLTPASNANTIEGKAEELRAMARKNEEMDIEAEAAALDHKAAAMKATLYKDLTAWRKCQVARHPERPHCRDYIDALLTEYTPLAGDRNFADDHAVMGGIGRLDGKPVMIIGHEKGNDTKSRIERNFGMARPEGYRKAIRLMELANRFGLYFVERRRQNARSRRGPAPDRAASAPVGRLRSHHPRTPRRCAPRQRCHRGLCR